MRWRQPSQGSYLVWARVLLWWRPCKGLFKICSRQTLQNIVELHQNVLRKILKKTKTKKKSIKAVIIQYTCIHLKINCGIWSWRYRWFVNVRWPWIKYYMTLTNVKPCWQQLFCYDLMTKKENKKNRNKKLHGSKRYKMHSKLDLWPPKGWPCGCQHDPIDQNSLHGLSQTKGHLISKRFLGSSISSKKQVNLRYHSSKVEFIRSFFWGNRWPQKLFRN